MMRIAEIERRAERGETERGQQAAARFDGRNSFGAGFGVSARSSW